MADVVASEQSANSKVVFTRRGGRAFLAEIWESGKQAGCRLHRQRKGKQIAESAEEEVTLLASADWR